VSQNPAIGKQKSRANATGGLSSYRLPGSSGLGNGASRSPDLHKHAGNTLSVAHYEIEFVQAFLELSAVQAVGDGEGKHS